MNDLRFELFTSNNRSKDVKQLPPTDTSFKYHILRSHLQVILWKAANMKSPPCLDIKNYGWELVDDIPTPVKKASIAPESLLKIVSCSCFSCSSARCSCRNAQLSCTSFCKCSAEERTCNNEFSTTRSDDSANEDDMC